MDALYYKPNLSYLKNMKKCFLCSLILFALLVCTLAPLHAEEQQPLSWEQQIIEMLLKNTIITFEDKDTKEALNNFSELIKDEYTYQFIIQKIDRFILTNELDEYEDQAEALKEALTEMRDYYIRAERETRDKYNEMKQQQYEREKQRELEKNNVIEV